MRDDRLYVCRLIDCYSGLLKERQSELADLYYNEDLSLAEIGENCGISRQGARDAIKRAVDALYDYEKKLGFLRKSDRITEYANEIIARTGDDVTRDIAKKILGEL